MRLLSIVSCAALAAAVLVAPDASAQRGGRNNQATTMVVLNYQRLLAETALGRDMAAKLQQVRAQVGAEAQALAPEQQSLAQESQRLNALRRNRTDEQVRADAALAPQFQALAQRAQQFEARAQSMRGDLECTQALAVREFDRQASPIIRSVMEQRGAGAVFDTSAILQHLPQFEITNTVIQQLDQNPATRTANVTRHALAECQAQPPAQVPAQ
jgi:Skp family chaperone for outer membrane proteins